MIMEAPSPMERRELNALQEPCPEPYPHTNKKSEESPNTPTSPLSQGNLSWDSPLVCNGNWSWGPTLSALPRDPKRILQMLSVPVKGSKKMLQMVAVSLQGNWSSNLRKDAKKMFETVSVPNSMKVFFSSSTLAGISTWSRRLPQSLPLPLTTLHLTKLDWISTWWTVIAWLSMLILAILSTTFLFGAHGVGDVPEIHSEVALESLGGAVCSGSLPPVMKLPNIYSFVESERERIYAYFEPPPLGHAHDVLAELSIVRHWKRSFLRYGWMPTLLSMADAAQVPGFQEMKGKLSALPTVNPAHYELSCFLRWIAMANVGGGYMSDYDIVNYGVSPPGRPLSDSIMGYEPHWPMFSSGKAGAYLAMAKAFASTSPENVGTENGQPHTSDLILSRSVYKNMFTISDLSVRPLFHYNHGMLAGIFGQDSPYSRMEKIRRSNCYQILAKMSPLQIIILPITEASAEIAENLQNALNECMQLTGVDGRKPDHVFENLQPYTIILTAPTIVATLLEEHEAYIRQRSIEQEFREYAEYLSHFKDTNDAPIQNITGHKSYLMDKILSSPRVLKKGQEYNSAELLNALAQDGVFIGFLDQPKESLELLEYEMGFFFDSATRERLIDSWTYSWTHMSLLLNGVPKDVADWMGNRFSRDECALQSMQSQFEARLEQLRRIQELEREPYVTNSHRHVDITNS